jgi:predicted metalloprotease with PDZ domain
MRTLKYRISPSFHALDIELTFVPARTGPLALHLPIWRPGRYQVQHFAKNIATVTCDDAVVVKSDLSTWTIDVKEMKPITVFYRYHAEQPDAGGSWVDESMVYINFVNCLLFPHRGENRACEVEVILPPAGFSSEVGQELGGAFPAKITPAGCYETFCSLRTYKNKLRAKSYRELVDSPFLAAPQLHTHAWKTHGVKFYLQGLGPKTHFSERLLKAYQKFVAYQLDYMGEFPVREYRFMLWICSKPFYHGVEHTKSTMMVMGPEDRDSYEDLIGLGSHELFHVWNVATIRPKALLPYDYTRVVIFDTGWIIEGITTYLGDWFLWASGVVNAEEYVNLLAGNLKLHFERDGASKQSLIESSVDLWLDGYGSALPGKRVSIYFKGALVALGLDLLIRRKFQHAKSLRDVMLLMQNRYGQLKSGYTRQDFYALVEEVYEESLSEFWSRWVESSHPLESDIAMLLESVGLQFESAGVLKIIALNRLEVFGVAQ